MSVQNMLLLTVFSLVMFTSAEVEKETNVVSIEENSVSTQIMERILQGQVY